MAKQRGLSGAVSASKAASERSVKVVVVERATREEKEQDCVWTGRVPNEDRVYLRSNNPYRWKEA